MPEPPATIAVKPPPVSLGLVNVTDTADDHKAFTVVALTAWTLTAVSVYVVVPPLVTAVWVVHAT